LELKPNSYDYRTLPPSISSDNFGRQKIFNCMALGGNYQFRS
jgi:hypothetical protein